MAFYCAAMKALDNAWRGRWRLAILCSALVFAAALVLFAQSGAAGQNEPTQNQNQNHATDPFTPPVRSNAPDVPAESSPILSDQSDPAMAQLMRHQAGLRNAQRQKDLVRDTQKLYVLAGQLKADVAKSNKDILSIEVIKKADEIEKLAKSVKDKMKGQ